MVQLNATEGFLLQYGLVCPLSISVALFLGLLYVGSPFWLIALLGILLAWGVAAPTGVVVFLGLALVLFGIRPVRQYVVTSLLLKIIQKVGIFPEVSETERVALEAGTVWVDADLFSGSPNVSKLMSEPYPSLTVEEQAFLNGPVQTLCEMINDWEVQKSRALPDEVWDFLKKEKFFGMIIPKKYGGLDLSPLAHSAVIECLSSRSSSAAITVMVPNSLGPAELLVHYGTEEQKNYYLPRLADGREIPCFGLTEPTAGSDAGAMQATGQVFKAEDGQLKLRLNFTKRWITLSGVSTVIGLAFKLEDPENLLGKGTSPGITCALIPRDTDGISLDTRHDPMGVPFWNCPIFGKDVEVSVDTIIGGAERAGEGWKMLMESLAAGRGISLPALSSGTVKLTARAAGAFSTIRKQFGISIGQFEGVQEPLGRIAGMMYMIDAARIYTSGALASGAKPAVITAIMKYHLTELARKCINDGMDVLGGAGISLGPRNLLGTIYKGIPIGITVEGANILTRTMIIFGQGALRCHPFAYPEIQASNQNNLKAFDRNFWGHVGHVAKNKVRALVLSVTRGWVSGHLRGPMAGYHRKLVWASASYAFIADVAMGYYGGSLKRKETITGRLGDILSWMFLATATMRRFEAEGRSHEPLARWALSYAFHQIDIAFNGLYQNMGGPFKWVFGRWSQLNPLSSSPSDQLTFQAAKSITKASSERTALTHGVFVSSDTNDALGRYENVLKMIEQIAPIEKKMRAAKIKKVEDAESAGIITASEAEQLKSVNAARLDAIQVDAFTQKDYLKA